MTFFFINYNLINACQQKEKLKSMAACTVKDWVFTIIQVRDTKMVERIFIPKRKYVLDVEGVFCNGTYG